MKKCSCGQTAWFGNYCHECRDRLIRAVSCQRRAKDPPISADHDHPHTDYRKKMSEQAAYKYGEPT